MADAYARVSGKVPVVTVQNGPAATLLVPGLARGAQEASIPIVAIVQDVQRSNRDRNAFQDLDHLALFGGCAKWIRRVDSLDRIADYVDMAFTAAAGGRPGPAVLLCPIDLFEDPITSRLPPATLIAFAPVIAWRLSARPGQVANGRPRHRGGATHRRRRATPRHRRRRSPCFLEQLQALTRTAAGSRGPAAIAATTQHGQGSSG